MTITELLKDKDLLNELLDNKTAEDAQAYLAGKGVEMSIDEVKALGKKIYAAVEGEGKLSEEELAEVAGGSGDSEGAAIFFIGELIVEGGKKLWDLVTSW